MSLLTLLALSLAAAAPLRFGELEEKAIETRLAELHAANPELAARLEAVSAGFLGTPYELGPLGEGEAGDYDRDPLISFQKADCTTFVEEVMALSFEPDLERAKARLAKIRYKDGKISFETRNHFPEVDWVPNNVGAGYLRDVTRTVAGRKTRWVFKTISKREWYLSLSTTDLRGFSAEPADDQLKRVERLRAAGEGMKDETARLPYVALEDLAEFASAIPSGTIANVVRDDVRGKPVLVTHQGWIFQKPGGAIFRHAAYGKQVEDVLLLDYAARFKDAKWRVLGFNLGAVVDSAPPAQ